MNIGLEEANRSNPVKALKLEKRTRSHWLLAMGYFTDQIRSRAGRGDCHAPLDLPASSPWLAH